MTFAQHARAVSAFKGSTRSLNESPKLPARERARALFRPGRVCARQKKKTTNMSDVRLSDASPTVERVDARQPESVRSVSRMLFGTPDPEETRRYMEAVQRENAQDFKERYNFDPATDTPLRPGIFEWVEDDEAPEFYRRPPHRSQRPPRGEARDSAGDERPNGEGSTKTEPAQGTNGSRKRRSGASGSCSDECQKKRSSSDRDDDEEDPDCVGSVVKSASRPEDNQEVPLNAEH